MTIIATGPLVIVAKKSLPANNLSELVAWLKANPDKALAGTGGVGTPPHVAGLFFQNTTGARFQCTIRAQTNDTPHISALGLSEQ